MPHALHSMHAPSKKNYGARTQSSELLTMPSRESELFKRLLELAVPPLISHLVKKSKETNQYSFRLTPQEQLEFEECIKLTGMDPKLLFHEAVRAFVSQVEAKGGIWLPLEIVAAKKTSTRSPDAGSRLIAPSGEEARLNEEATPPTRFTPTRAALRAMAQKQTKG
jgi:hypothetical protein